jgi:hypothetical protein
VSERPRQSFDDLQARDVVGVGLDIDEELGEPAGIFSKAEATDQRGTVDVGSREYVEHACSWFSESRDDALAEVVLRQRIHLPAVRS